MTDLARFLDACGVPALDRQATVERGRELVSATGLALLEVTLSGDAAEARVLPVAGREAPPAAV